MSVNGLVVMTPTGSPPIIASGTGSSASVGANGKVTFSLCTSLSLNGVFTSSYDNYVISIRHTGSTSAGIRGRYRASGVDASGTNYTSQYIFADGTSVSALRTTGETSARMGAIDTAQRGGESLFIFGPYLSQPTAARCSSAYAYLNGSGLDDATTHSLSTSYDGLTLFPTSGTFTGAITVYGFNQ